MPLSFFPRAAVSLAPVLATALVAGLVAAVPAAAAPAAAPSVALPTAISSSSRPADSAGSLAPGRTSYSYPSKAVFVSKSGSDRNSGTKSSPLKTITRALAVAPTGGTIVVRRGAYHESVDVQKRVTIQSYPREAVWLEGSRAIGGWVKDGATWRRSSWTQRFDASVGYSKGDKDGTSPGWQWVNPSYPMASHPDQVFVGGKALRQVASKSAVGKGEFYLDTSTSRLYIGSDPAAGVRASDQIRALRIRAAGTVVRGIGVRRFSPSIWHVGSVLVEAPKVQLNNVTITDSATIGLGVTTADVRLYRVSVLRSGLLGVHAATADRLVVYRSRIDDNNVERFNNAPVSGGIKAGRTRKITVKFSSLSGNQGPGFWSDVSVYDTRMLGNDIVGNRGAGVFLEISAKGTIADNLISSNKADGVKVNNTSDVQIWNNAIVRNGRALNLVQDPRRPDNTSYGHDKRYPDDPSMTWLLGPVTVRNNVLGLPRVSSNCVLCVEDYSHERTAEQIGVSSNGNFFNRAPEQTTRWLSVWSRGSKNVNPSVFTTLGRHRDGTRQDGRSLSVDNARRVYLNGGLSSYVRDKANAQAVPLDSGIASQIGRPSGIRHAGIFGRG